MHLRLPEAGIVRAGSRDIHEYELAA